MNGYKNSPDNEKLDFNYKFYRENIESKNNHRHFLLIELK